MANNNILNFIQKSVLMLTDIFSCVRVKIGKVKGIGQASIKVVDQGTTQGDILSGDDLGRCWGDWGHIKQAVLLAVHLTVRLIYSPLGRRALLLQPKTATLCRS